MNDRLPLILVADNIRSLFNIGSLFRLADGVHIEAIYLCGISGYPKMLGDLRPSWVSDRADKEIRKTGLDGVDHIPFRYFESTLEAIKELRSKNYQISSLELTESSIDYRETPYRFPLAIIVGHETDGVSSEALKASDSTIHLPMLGHGKSLNVSTASAALLYYLEEYYRTHKLD